MWDIRDISKKPFAESVPQNYVAAASTTLGSGTNGTITITHDDMTTTDKIEVVLGSGESVAMSAAYSGGKITVTLGTNASSTADSTKNTATLITAAINGISGKKWTAVASGTGATAISAAVAAKSFTNGHRGTPCPVDGTVYNNSGTYYVCLKADNTDYNTGWKTFSLSNI